MDLVPKVEKENPSTAEISEHIIPAIKNWDVGDHYIVKLSVEMVSISQGSMYDPNHSKEARASFKVSGGEAIEMDHQNHGNEEMAKKINNRKAFIRSVVKVANEHMDKEVNRGKAFIRSVVKVANEHMEE